MMTQGLHHKLLKGHQAVNVAPFSAGHGPGGSLSQPQSTIQIFLADGSSKGVVLLQYLTLA
jgi:hypothetical protein